MKRIILSAVLLVTVITISAQQTDAGRIILNSVVLDKDNKVPEEAKNLLSTKLTQIATANGMGGNSITPRFVLAAKINVLTKDIVAGSPQMIAINAEIVFFTGDATDNVVYNTATLTVKGVGTNENKAFISAIQNINVKNKDLSQMVEGGKNKIVDYYSSHCDFIIKKSNTLAGQQQYQAALYELMQVPEVCKSCYDKCLDAVQPIYQKMIDRNCLLQLNDAKVIWNANPNGKGALLAGPVLAKIEPGAACYNEALKLSEIISKKIEADEKRNWEFKMKKYADGVKLEQQRIEAARQTAIAFYQNQPTTIIYSRLIW